MCLGMRMVFVEIATKYDMGDRSQEGLQEFPRN